MGLCRESCKVWIRLNCLNPKAHESGASPTYAIYRSDRIVDPWFQAFARARFTDDDGTSMRGLKSLSGDPDTLLDTSS
jgi:hypothetical protein